MDDAGLDERIDRHAEVLDNQELQKGKARQEATHELHHEETHIDPSRWWFASSAFPMIAGTMGPIASAFSICALVRPWLQHLPPGTDIREGVYVTDPTWLIVVNATQLVVAVISNVFLLLNMARRVRFSIAQPITIVGWYTSAFCLVGLVAAGAGELLHNLEKPENEYVWSQAFWYGVWAALLYFFVASLMAVTMFGAHKGRYPKDFNLTNSQRTLMLQTMMVLAYLLLGALVFSNLEGWSYLDGVYWSCVTIFTVGFGDFSLMSHTGRGLLLPYSLVGIISLGLVIGSIRSLVLERGRRRIEARVVEMARRRHLRRMVKHGKDDILAPISGDAETSSSRNGPNREFLRRRAEFELMRKIQAEAARRRRWVALGSSVSTWAVLWLVGAKVFEEAERPYQNWSFWDGVYFTYVSLATIGYGDRVPHSNCGKSFFVFWALLALPTTTVLISNAGDTVVKFVRDVTIQGGKVTILPGENGFMQEVRNIINWLSCGRLSNGPVDGQTSPGSDDGSSKQDEKKAALDRDVERDPGGTHQHNIRSVGREVREGPDTDCNPTLRLNPHKPTDWARDPGAPLPTGTELHLIIIEEIARVTADIISKNKREYTFEEWAWFLKLLGEDEASADTHRRARHDRRRRLLRSRQTRDDVLSPSRPPDTPPTRSPRLEEQNGEDGHGHGASEFPEEMDQEEKWSWVGRKSPLLAKMDESGWILQRLTAKLQHELAQTMG